MCMTPQSPWQLYSMLCMAGAPRDTVIYGCAALSSSKAGCHVLQEYQALAKDGANLGGCEVGQRGLVSGWA